MLAQWISEGGVTIEIKYQYDFRVNADIGWRQYLAGWLRTFAWMLDDRQHLSIEMITIPPVSREEQMRIINYGTDAMHQAMIDALRIEAQESWLEHHSDAWK